MQKHTSQRRGLLKAVPALALAAAGITLLPATAFAASKINVQDGFAVKGYDPVAYFTQGKAVRGNSAHRLSYGGASWRFSSAQNLAAFSANPDKYAPQYGGYCAFAVSKGGLANGSPEAWTIHKGKLYLNVNKTVRGFWSADKDGNIAKANANWPQVLN